VRVQLNARNRAYQFEATPGARMLYSGLAAGINLPYECGSGTCGTCKARLVEGEIDDRWPEASGRKYLKQPGEFLMCQCVPAGDCSVEVAGFVYNMDPGACIPAFARARSATSRPLTRDVMSFSVELESPADFDAGQFVAMQVPGVPGYRGYSMVNFERGATSLEFVIKKKPGGGASEWLFGAGAEGKAVELFGPLGSATFYPEPRQEHPLHRRRQRHRRHDVDPGARAAGALLQSVQRPRVLRRAHLQRRLLSRGARELAAEFPTACA
jgi:toluene monooxygenase electron transfer component